MAADPSPADVPQWLKTLPLAPEYHPTPAEFHDPIAYILKIEKEASCYGICKIVPPLPAPPRRTAIGNLNRSFAARSASSEGPRKAPTFTTRRQQVGFCPRRPRPVQRSVWQSGEYYTLEQFEAKAKQFERSQLKRAGKKAFLPLEIESLFWKACADKPISVEYANDMPGSGFAPLGAGKKRVEEDGGNVGDTLWNMRAVSRSKGSLLRFMKEEIPGVTSPMVYVAMMFSWFAWHVEDHDLHSLNYLHMGAGKTWYGVPRDARLAFEEVVRVHGYAEEMNPLVTFTTLGEKTTVISPDVLMDAGIPCCRLVQNAGEFVVTFPGSYHSGFSHGFNCGEAANIATPEWLRVAKEAAMRRASTNYPPMVSHYQLLYALALSLCSRVSISCSAEPRSSRLKDKMRGEGEIMVKEIFVESVIKNNNLLSALLDEGSCIILPKNTSYSPCSSTPTRNLVKIKPRLPLGFQSQQLSKEALPSDDIMIEGSEGRRHFNGYCSVKEHDSTVSQGKKLYSSNGKLEHSSCSSTPELQSLLCASESALQGNGLLDQGLLSCVTCGILSFACVALVQPREATARYLMSSCFSSFNDQFADSGEMSDADNISNWRASDHHMVSGSGQAPVTGGSLVSNTFSVKASDQREQIFSKTTRKGISALDLLASAYGVSDSEEEADDEMFASADGNDMEGSSLNCKASVQLTSTSKDLSLSTTPYKAELQLDRQECKQGNTGISRIPFARLDTGGELSVQNSCNIADLSNLDGAANPKYVDTCQVKIDWNGQEDAEKTASRCLKYGREMLGSSVVGKMNSKLLSTYSGDEEFNGRFQLTGNASINRDDMETENPGSNSEDFSRQLDTCIDSAAITGNVHLKGIRSSMKESAMSDMLKYDKDSSRMHVFCLEHALEVEKQLQPMGGVDVMLLCHPDYPKAEEEAKLLSEELDIDHEWKAISFREATEEDKERIQTALEDEQAIPMNSDWAVKMGINLYYSASQSKSPLYSKQMPYNAIIYKVFGRESPDSSPMKRKGSAGRLGRQKKIVVAGRWCGKVWMSNQVHPYLAHINEAQEHEYEDKLHQVPIQKTKVKSNTQCIKIREQSNRDISIGSTPLTRKSGRKRKRPSGKSRTQKQRYTQLDKTDISEDVPEISCSSKCRKVLCSSPIRNLSKTKCQEDCSQHEMKLEDGAEKTSSTRLRRQQPKLEGLAKPTSKKSTSNRKARKAQTKDLSAKDDDGEEEEYSCDLEGCSMSFSTKHDLALHKRNICPFEGCGKKFFSHKYLLQHRKVHLDDRPLKCPWKGCKMTFKWPWARTEHIRVHTGARPYVCKEAGCGQTFRFVSDFSRHKRKTGHSVKKTRK